MDLSEEIANSVKPKRRFVNEIKDADGDIYFLPFDEDPVASFGPNITVVCYELVGPVNEKEAG